MHRAPGKAQKAEPGWRRQQGARCTSLHSSPRVLEHTANKWETRALVAVHGEEAEKLGCRVSAGCGEEGPELRAAIS